MDDDTSVIHKRSTLVKDTHFSYLDIEMYWNLRDKLKFKVHMKPKLKYLNNDSTHLPSVFRAIPSGVFNRLSKLILKSKKIEKPTIDKIYPLHTKVLGIIVLAPKNTQLFLDWKIFKTKQTPWKRRKKRKKRRKEEEEK